MTVPRHVGQVPLHYSHKPTGGHSYWHQDYVDGSHLPLWPFGFGLSYSRFELADLRLVERRRWRSDGEVVVSVDVANVGDRTGDEVVQLYVRDLAASVTRPMKELRDSPGSPWRPASDARSPSRWRRAARLHRRRWPAWSSSPAAIGSWWAPPRLTCRCRRAGGRRRAARARGADRFFTASRSGRGDPRRS